jgi:hypothetical protein
VARLRRGHAPPPGRDRGAGRTGHRRSPLTLIDAWAYGASLIPAPYAGRRIGWCDVWLRVLGANPYAHPVAGRTLVVDMNTTRDTGGVAEGEAGPDPGGEARRRWYGYGVAGHETVVERQIRLAQERGDFDDLPGRGKPLPGLDGPPWWRRLTGRMRRRQG